MIYFHELWPGNIIACVTIEYVIIDMAVIIVMGDKSFEF